jgi:hypothetical protein
MKSSYFSGKIISMKYLFILLLPMVFISCGESNSGEEEEAPQVVADSTGAIEEETVSTIDINLEKIDDVPSKCEFPGVQIDAYTWEDENGVNYFIRSIGEIEAGESQYSSDPGFTQYLWADHYVEKNDEFTQLREITDFVKDCEFDLIVSHELDALTLTDLDNDNIAEVSFIYRLACTSDVSPSNQKLILLENGEKYALRGSTQVMGDGGEYEVGEEFDNASKEFLEHAKQLWSEHLTEYDFEL